jgi:ATP diphosphatase
MGYTLPDLLRVMQRLRDPDNGCPWDIRQDFHSIVPSTLEECYELAQAIEHRDYSHVAEELGDVLFQVVFYAQLGREQNLFTFDEIVDTLVEKLVRRHPHVFAHGEIEGLVPREQRSSLDSIKESWESIKEGERAARSQTGVLDDVPVALPALPRAQKLQKRAGRVGFDWSDSVAVLDKLEEEVAELRCAMERGEERAVEDELGDVIFTCVNLARHQGLDSEATLRRSSAKFERRFRAMEGFVQQTGESLEGKPGDELEALWERAKKMEAL